jgi:uncharacterized caspase-like protein
MPPISLGTSRFTLALETGQAKLWILLVGVNEYQDRNLPRLRYSALDCQGLGESLSEATQTFPQKEITIHHDFAQRKPLLESVKASLAEIVVSAKTQDTVLFYFSGHGLLDIASQQTVLCLADTEQENLLNTGLTLQELLTMFGRCSAHCQVVWLDACHCGNMTLTGARGGTKERSLDNPTAQLLEALRQRAAKSKGFYALLSCDQGQQSWEFPDLGHGVFSYFLMRGLRGEAANPRGVIEADGLYRYVYNQTLQYIDKANQQLRLINQQKRHRGDPHLYSEYSLQTPKRIVEGVGELILGLKSASLSNNQQRHALMVESWPEDQTSTALSEVFQKEGHFAIAHLATVGKQETEVQQTIQSFLQPWTLTEPNNPTYRPLATLLLYLRGQIEVEAKGESYLVWQNGVRISRSWLRQELRRSHLAQQIVILDCQGTGSIEEWIEELKLCSDHGQCLLGASVPDDDLELFAQVLLESLIAANPQAGLSVAEWLGVLQTNCEQLGMSFAAWLSGTQGVIDILPGKIEESLQDIPKVAPSITEPPPPSATTDTPATASLSPEQYANLSQFLTELVGPIALPLLQSAWEQTSSANELLDNLAQYLSPPQKKYLDKWAISMVEKEENTSLPSVAVSVVPLSESQPQAREAIDSKLSAEQYAQLEAILKEIVGPIAPMLLAQISEQFPQAELLLASFRDYLTSEQKAHFERRIASIFTQTDEKPESVIPPVEVKSPEPTATAIDETFIHQCEQELTQLIGPVAQFIITTTLQERPEISRTEFVATIAAEIPNSEQATYFRQHWTTK